jgi:hypothetical protein
MLGEGVEKIATRIKAVTEMSRRQAVTVARTETLRVANQGRMLGAYQARDEYGIEMRKRWVSTKDNRTRDDHVEMLGVTVELDEPFELPDGTLMDFPLDPNGPAHQVINCMCVHVEILKGYSFSEKNTLKESIGSVDNGVGSGIMKIGGESRVHDSRLEYPVMINEREWIPRYTEIINVHTIAGYGSVNTLREADRLFEEYGGNSEGWMKRVGKIDSDKYVVDIHWYEHSTVGKYEYKIKHYNERVN